MLSFFMSCIFTQSSRWDSLYLASFPRSGNDRVGFLVEKAVMDVVVLSKSNRLIRTSSSLSLWSSYLNPGLPVLLLNERFCEKPES
jgi:hypothetical protein